MKFFENVVFFLRFVLVSAGMVDVVVNVLVVIVGSSGESECWMVVVIVVVVVVVMVGIVGIAGIA